MVSGIRNRVRALFMILPVLLIMPALANASAFTENLTKEYFDLARVQYYYSDDPFAVKARAADKGMNVLPDDPAKRKKLTPEDRSDLVAAHGRLMAALDGGFREQNPKQAALAQTSFDCWLQAADEAHGRDWRCVRQCREAFLSAMQAWSPPQPAPKPMPKPKPMAKPAPKPAPPAPPRSFIVFFDWNRANIRPDARKLIDTAAAYAKRKGFSHVTLTGHADRSGRAKYNMVLSRRRAEAVKAALVKLGLAAAGITVEAKGEGAPLVGTADGVREPRNRRVEIHF